MEGGGYIGVMELVAINEKSSLMESLEEKRLDLLGHCADIMHSSTSKLTSDRPKRHPTLTTAVYHVENQSNWLLGDGAASDSVPVPMSVNNLGPVAPTILKVKSFLSPELMAD